MVVLYSAGGVVANSGILLKCDICPCLKRPMHNHNYINHNLIYINQTKHGYVQPIEQLALN